MQTATPSSGRHLTWGAFVLPLLTAALLSPWNAYFLGNALYLGLPSLVIVAIARALSRSGAVAFGCAIALALYGCLFKAWVLAQPPDGLVWLGYFFSLPGAALGALVAALLARVTPAAPSKMLALGAIATGLGATLNMTGLCATLVYCTF
mgnify:FL=1